MEALLIVLYDRRIVWVLALESFDSSASKWVGAETSYRCRMKLKMILRISTISLNVSEPKGLASYLIYLLSSGNDIMFLSIRLIGFGTAATYVLLVEHCELPPKTLFFEEMPSSAVCLTSRYLCVDLCLLSLRAGARGGD